MHTTCNPPGKKAMIATSTIQAYKDDTERDREGSSILGIFFFF